MSGPPGLKLRITKSKTRPSRILRYSGLALKTTSYRHRMSQRGLMMPENPDSVSRMTICKGKSPEAAIKHK